MTTQSRSAASLLGWGIALFVLYQLAVHLIPAAMLLNAKFQ
jgi:uncharacterized membrane protein required for colicin V production